MDRKLKLGDGVIIDWQDSKAMAGWSYGPNKLREPGFIRSLGFVVQLNPKCVTITTSMDKLGASMDDLSIPLGCVTKIEVLPKKYKAGA